jgi:hypothetical protein
VAPVKPLALAALAQAELALGSGSEALAHARAARALLPEVGQSQDDTTVRVVLIETLIGAGELEAARAEAAAARALLEARVALIDNPTYRNRFMTEIPPHARLVGLGKQLEA